MNPGKASYSSNFWRRVQRMTPRYLVKATRNCKDLDVSLTWVEVEILSVSIGCCFSVSSHPTSPMIENMVLCSTLCHQDWSLHETGSIFGEHNESCGPFCQRYRIEYVDLSVEDRSGEVGRFVHLRTNVRLKVYIKSRQNLPGYRQLRTRLVLFRY